MGKLNPVLHQELRLTLISYLVNVTKADFKKLMEISGGSKGNVSVQLSKLEKEKYLTIKKSFKGNYPHTEYRITKNGEKAYTEYLETIKKMLNL